MAIAGYFSVACNCPLDAMYDQDLQALLDDLKSTSKDVRDHATQALWKRWFYQKGVRGLQQLEQTQTLMSAGQYRDAERFLTDLVTSQPDFAEAWNRLAILYYVIKDYRQALSACDRVIELVPVHFGAIHGKGLCHMALGNYMAAIQSFRQALEIQPYALVNQKLILECTAHLS